MLLLVNSQTDASSQLAHIPDAAERPICRNEFDLTDWYVVEVAEALPTICPSCQRIQEQRQAAIESELPSN